MHLNTESALRNEGGRNSTSETDGMENTSLFSSAVPFTKWVHSDTVLCIMIYCNISIFSIGFKTLT